MQPKYVMVYTCIVCEQVFTVPWFPEGDALPPEMVTVIEHEEAHTENGDSPAWDMIVKVKEEKSKDDYRESGNTGAGTNFPNKG